MLRTLAAIRTFGVATVVTAHVSKEMAERRAGAPLRPYGSVFVWNLARSCWEIQRSRDHREHELLLELYHRKINEGPRHAPFGLRLSFDPAGDLPTAVTVEAHQISVDEGLITEASVSQRILLVMHAGNPMESGEIAHAAECSKETAERTLRRLREQGKVANPATSETDGDRQMRWVKTAQ